MEAALAKREISGTLSKANQEMLRGLAQRAQSVCTHLSGEALKIPNAFQPEVPSTHVFLFTKLVETLEPAVSKLDALVEGECCSALALAGKLIFSNLWLLREDREFG